MSRTDYVVLMQDSDQSWVVLDGAWEATSAKGAIRAALSVNGSGAQRAGGEIVVAVPKRSWQPQPVRIETQQRLKIG